MFEFAEARIVCGKRGGGAGAGLMSEWRIWEICLVMRDGE